jgi:hypothetical protein
MKSVTLLLLAILMSSCKPTTHAQFVKKADASYVSMIKILADVQHPSDLYLVVKLKPYYKNIAELIIQASEVESKNKDVFNVEIIEAPHAEELKNELKRVYELEGGAAACEAAALDALMILKKASLKKKSSF